MSNKCTGRKSIREDTDTNKVPPTASLKDLKATLPKDMSGRKLLVFVLKNLFHQLGYASIQGDHKGGIVFF